MSSCCFLLLLLKVSFSKLGRVTYACDHLGDGGRRIKNSNVASATKKDSSQPGLYGILSRKKRVLVSVVYTLKLEQYRED